MNEPEKYFVQPGFIYATQKETVISTVLGSCISVCLWDGQHRFGGMNHFIYPRTNSGDRNSRYGNIAIPHLLKLMERMGSKRQDLIAHVIGGASNPLLNSNIGMDNIEVAKRFMEKYRIPIINLDVGGTLGRKISFNTETGEVLIYKCMKLRDGDWYGQD